MSNYFKVEGEYNVGGTEMFEPQDYIVEESGTHMLIELINVHEKNYFLNFGSEEELQAMSKKCVNTFFIHKLKRRPATKTDIYKEAVSDIDHDYMTPPSGFYDNFDEDTFDDILEYLKNIVSDVEEIAKLNDQGQTREYDKKWRVKNEG